MNIKPDASAGFLPRERLPSLFDAIGACGYQCLTPTVKDHAIVFAPYQGLNSLPWGVEDHTLPGRYELNKTDRPRAFAWASNAQAIKPHVFRPQELLWTSTEKPLSPENPALAAHFEAADAEPPGIALIGVRACDLAALALQDKHFMQGGVQDAAYARRRDRLLTVAVHCSRSNETCFCHSTGDGPSVRPNSADLTIGELDDGLVLYTGSEQGAQVLLGLKLDPVTDQHWLTLNQENEAAAASQTRTLPSRDLRSQLYSRLKDHHWTNVGDRCLSCGNCTAVCPSCFCYRACENQTLDGSSTEHLREWDSCFSARHAHLAGMEIRPDSASRYRQWMVHKLATWHEQYGRSGCTGCGRCIAWCPVGIDLVSEVTALLDDTTESPLP